MVRAELHRLAPQVGKVEGAPLRNAADVVAFMEEKHSASLRTDCAKRDAARKVGARFFSVVPESVDDNVTLAASAVPGTRSIHAVRPTTLPGIFLSRALGCGCLPCCSRNYEDCENGAWCGPWAEQRVAADPTSKALSRETRGAAAAAAAAADDSDDEAEPADAMLHGIVVGDVVAVEAPWVPERGFELLLVKEAPRALAARYINHALKDDDDNPVVYGAGEVVIAGHWFQGLGNGNTYELWDQVWADNKHDVAGFTPWQGAPRVVVRAADVRRRAIALEPVAPTARNLSGAKTIRRFKIDAHTLEMLEEVFAE